MIRFENCLLTDNTERNLRCALTTCAHWKSVVIENCVCLSCSHFYHWIAEHHKCWFTVTCEMIPINLKNQEGDWSGVPRKGSLMRKYLRPSLQEARQVAIREAGKPGWAWGMLTQGEIVEGLWEKVSFFFKCSEKQWKGS